MKPDIYCQDTRGMIVDIKADIVEIKTDVKEAFNHMSTRLPLWASIAMAFLSSLSIGLIVAFFR